jgi:hypothetical protein
MGSSGVSVSRGSRAVVVALIALAAVFGAWYFRAPILGAVDTESEVITTRKSTLSEPEALDAKSGPSALPERAYGVRDPDASSFSVFDQSLRNRLLGVLDSGDISAIPNVDEALDLMESCGRFERFRNGQHVGWTAAPDSLHAFMEFMEERCFSTVPDSFVSAIVKLRMSEDPVIGQSRSLAGYGEDQRLYGPVERSRLVKDLLLQANSEEAIKNLLQALSVELDGQTRFDMIEGLPQMGNIHDYRSWRFLYLVSQLVSCAEWPRCGPNSIKAMQMCYPVGLCYRGISVRDVLVATYSARELHAAEVAASRIIAARRQWRASS